MPDTVAAAAVLDTEDPDPSSTPRRSNAPRKIIRRRNAEVLAFTMRPPIGDYSTPRWPQPSMLGKKPTGAARISRPIKYLTPRIATSA
jgi:hypothetical protein